MIRLIYFFSFILLAACSGGNQPEKENKIAPTTDSLAIDTVANKSVAEAKIYTFSMTVDPKFCNPDSLVEGDCNSGFLYFTANGNVIYYYNCVNTDDVGEDNFCIGKASTAKKSKDLIFDLCYTFKYSFKDDSPTSAELNNGKLEKMDPFKISLQRISCGNAYSFTSGDRKNPEYYIVNESTDKSENEFLLRDLSRIEALKKF